MNSLQTLFMYAAKGLAMEAGHSAEVEVETLTPEEAECFLSHIRLNTGTLNFRLKDEKIYPCLSGW